MEMRILSETSRWLLENRPALEDRWGTMAWHEAFDGCGSPTEFQQFTQDWAGSTLLKEIRVQYEAQAREAFKRRPVHAPVHVEL